MTGGALHTSIPWAWDVKVSQVSRRLFLELASLKYRPIGASLSLLSLLERKYTGEAASMQKTLPGSDSLEFNPLVQPGHGTARAGGGVMEPNIYEPLTGSARSFGSSAMAWHSNLSIHPCVPSPDAKCGVRGRLSADQPHSTPSRIGRRFWKFQSNKICCLEPIPPASAPIRSSSKVHLHPPLPHNNV